MTTLNSFFDVDACEDTVPGYFDSPAGQIYHVMHHATTQRRGAVLLCGTDNIERERAYPTFVKWARALALQGFDTIRFDYRGIGESTGRFEDMTITSWRDDAAYCAARLTEISQGVPLIIHGTRVGALIASELFASGVGDALLLWAPPPSGKAFLWNTLRRNMVNQMVNDPKAPRQTREQQVAALEAGELLNVEGYFWTGKFWSDAQQYTLLIPSETEKRPWHVIHVKNRGISSITANKQGHEDYVDTDMFWENSIKLPPDSDDLFRVSLRWLDEKVLGGWAV